MDEIIKETNEFFEKFTDKTGKKPDPHKVALLFANYTDAYVKLHGLKNNNRN